MQFVRYSTPYERTNEVSWNLNVTASSRRMVTTVPWRRHKANIFQLLSGSSKPHGWIFWNLIKLPLTPSRRIRTAKSKSHLYFPSLASNRIRNVIITYVNFGTKRQIEIYHLPSLCFDVNNYKQLRIYLMLVSIRFCEYMS